MPALEPSMALSALCTHIWNRGKNTPASDTNISSPEKVGHFYWNNFPDCDQVTETRRFGYIIPVAYANNDNMILAQNTLYKITKITKLMDYHLS